MEIKRKAYQRLFDWKKKQTEKSPSDRRSKARIQWRAILKTSKSEPARRLSGHKTGKKPQNTAVFLCFLPFFCLENPQAFSNSRFLEVPWKWNIEPATIQSNYERPSITERRHAIRKHDHSNESKTGFKIFPIEVKPSKNYTTTSLIKFKD